MVVNDVELIKKARSGKKRAFDMLINKYHKKVLYLAYDLVGNFDDAKDVAQEAFIRSYKKLAQFEERAQFSTWLYRITVNCAIDHHRRRKRYPVDSLEEEKNAYVKNRMVLESMQTSVSQLERNEISDQIENALNKLSLNQRTATVLKFYHEKSSKEIGDIMGCSEGTVRIHLFRAMKKLKLFLNENILF